MRLIAAGQRVQSFAFDGHWLDMGTPEDYQRAFEDFKQMRALFLPESE